MSEVKISALPAGGALTGNEVEPIVQGGVTVKSPKSATLTYINNNAQLISPSQITGFTSTVYTQIISLVGILLQEYSLNLDVFSNLNTTGVIKRLGFADFTAGNISESDVTNLISDLAALLPLAGGTMTGNLILNGSPTQALQAVTKQYADSIAGGLTVKASCEAATTANLNATYNNGSSGVGATLTNAGAQIALVIDDVTLNLDDRVLVKDQTTQFQNGIYVVTDKGSVSTNWVLTRSTDYDNSPTGEIIEGSYTVITNGTVNLTNLYIETGSGPFTVGTTPIIFSPFSSAANITAGFGLTKSGNTISVIGADFLQPTNNLSDVSSTSTALANLGGVSTARNISASGLLTGGGNLSADRTITLSPAAVLQPLNNLSEVNSAAAARANLGLTIGTNVEAWSAQLDALAALATTGVIKRVGSNSFTAGLINESDVNNLITDLASKLAISGGTMTGNLILNADPTQALQAVTKQYTDSIAGGLTVKTSCEVATTADLDASYNNGTLGVGASLTNAGTQDVLFIDGINPNVDDRILVKDQIFPSQNGIYYVQDVGSLSTNWKMYRATDYDESSKIVEGSYTAIIQGTINATNLYIETGSGPFTVGTTPIIFSPFSSAANITAGVGLTKSGNVISVIVADFLQPTNNLSEVTSVSTARSNLGLGTIATQNADNVSLSGGYIDGIYIGVNASCQIYTNFLYVQNSVVGYIPTNFNYYEEYTLNFDWGGAFTLASQSASVVRTGKTVTLLIPEAIQTATANSTLTASTALPARFRPVDATNIPVIVQDASLSGGIGYGRCIVTNLGIITVGINASNSPFTTGATRGVSPINGTWNVS